MFLRVFTLLFMLSTSSVAGPALPALDDAAIVRLITRDLEAHAHVLSREVHLFHWAYLPKTGIRSLETRSSQASSYLAKAANELFSQGNSGSTIGGGLYAAVDPTSSIKYGGEDPALFEIRIPAGKAFVDYGATNPSTMFSLETVEALSAAGCRIGLDIPKTNLNKHCKVLFDRGFSEMHVVGFRYHYEASQLNHCETLRHELMGAFDLGPEALSGSDVSVYSPKQKPSPEIEILHTLFQFQKLNVNLEWSDSPFFYPPPSSRRELNQIIQRNQESAARRVRDHFLGCDTARFPEDLWEDQLLAQVDSIDQRLGLIKLRSAKLSAKKQIPIDYRTIARQSDPIAKLKPEETFPITLQSLQKVAALVSPGGRAVFAEPAARCGAVKGEVLQLCIEKLARDFVDRSTEQSLAHALALLNASFKLSPSEYMEKVISGARELIRLHPFEKNNAKIASAVLQLALEARGLPLIPLSLKEDELEHSPGRLLRTCEEELLRRTHEIEGLVK